MTDLQSRHIAADLDSLSGAVAQSRRKAWRKLCAYWVQVGYIPQDPSIAVKSPCVRSEGHAEWTHEDVEAFRAHWPEDTRQRLALELLQWTGARVSDAVRLGPGMVDRDGLLAFTQEKTKKPVLLPWSAPSPYAADRRDLSIMTDNSGHMVWLTTIHGKPRSKKAFSGWFAEAARKAGGHKTAHGLRKYRMNRLAEAGAPVLAMQSWCGHVTLKEIEDYTRKASRRAAMLGAQSKNTVNWDK